MTKTQILKDLRAGREAALLGFRLAYNGNEERSEEGGSGRVWSLWHDRDGLIEEHSSMQRAAARLLEIAGGQP